MGGVGGVLLHAEPAHEGETVQRREQALGGGALRRRRLVVRHGGDEQAGEALNRDVELLKSASSLRIM